MKKRNSIVQIKISQFMPRSNFGISLSFVLFNFCIWCSLSSKFLQFQNSSVGNKRKSHGWLNTARCATDICCASSRHEQNCISCPICCEFPMSSRLKRGEHSRALNAFATNWPLPLIEVLSHSTTSISCANYCLNWLQFYFVLFYSCTSGATEQWTES